MNRQHTSSTVTSRVREFNGHVEWSVIDASVSTPMEAYFVINTGVPPSTSSMSWSVRVVPRHWVFFRAGVHTWPRFPHEAQLPKTERQLRFFVEFWKGKQPLTFDDKQGEEDTA